ncbi:MAG: hypothetical protein ACREMA_13755, partial [Longimicrobiales bacterium]
QESVMKRSIIGWSTLFVLLIAPASAQEKPNFAGRWSVPAPEPRGGGPGDGRGGAGGDGRGGGGGRGAAAGDMGSGWGSTLNITQDASKLTVEYAFFGRGDMQPPIKFVYALDGSESKQSVMMGRGIQAQTSRTAWNGDKLIITTVYPFTNPATGQPATSEVVRTLTLEPAGSLIVETTRTGVLGGPTTTTRAVYSRAQ